jgi:hypothetical protein
MTEKTLLDNIAETIEHEFNARIQDGMFIVEPAEAGIAMLAAMAAGNEAETRAWEASDELARQLEKTKQENSRYRDLLEGLSILLTELGYESRADEVERALWPVVGVLEDGTEVEFEYDATCETCARGWACECDGAE